MHSVQPGARTLQAFGLTGNVENVDGGQGLCVRVGDAILKPVEDVIETEYVSKLQCRLLKNIKSSPSPGYMLAEPFPTTTGNFVADGWSATRVIPGTSGPKGRWDRILVASRKFHKDLEAISDPPPFIAERTHRWAKGDRVAWSEEEYNDVVPEYREAYERLRKLLKPTTYVDLKQQLVHLDLSGNILLMTDDSLPGIIDFSLYWRPVEFADAVIVADGLLWYEGDETLIRRVGVNQVRLQMLICAFIFRLVASSEGKRENRQFNSTEPASFQRAIDIIEQLLQEYIVGVPT